MKDSMKNKLGPRFGAKTAMKFAALCGVLATSGCIAETGDDWELGEKSQELWLRAPTWPGGIIPVCWDSATTSRADFALRSRQVRDLANNSWPAVANVEFTGWGTCPSNTAGMVKIKLDNSTNANAGGFGFVAAGLTMSLGVNRGDFLGSLIPHEFGHVLGFAHEMARGDFNEGPSPGSCTEADVAGNGVNTAPDRDSIMASTGYCQNNPNLTIWDAVGAMTAYGPRVNQVRPLITGWNSSRTDHATVATQAGIDAVNGASYSWAYADGWVFTQAVPGTVPLKLYWHAGRQDNFLTATTAGQQSAVAAGYTLVRTEGYVFSSDQGSATEPLKLYWHSGRNDNMLTASPLGEQAALAAGYQFVRTEGYLPRETPYVLTQVYWSASREDNLTTKANTDLAIDAHNAGYAYAGYDGALLRFPFQGTTQYKNYYSSARGDHFGTATAAGESSALAAGYILVNNEDRVGEPNNNTYRGYVYTSSVTGMSAMKSYWHSGRGDNFTTISRGSVATNAGYSTTRTEGWALQVNP